MAATYDTPPPRIVRQDGTLDLFALNDSLHILHGLATNTNNKMEGALKDVEELKKFRQSFKEAQQFEAGVAAGRGKLFGFLDRTIVLFIGLGGLTVALARTLVDLL